MHACVYVSRLSCNTESFAIEGASIEHELIPILTSDIGVYGEYTYLFMYLGLIN